MKFQRIKIPFMLSQNNFRIDRNEGSSQRSTEVQKYVTRQQNRFYPIFFRNVNNQSSILGRENTCGVRRLFT